MADETDAQQMNIGYPEGSSALDGLVLESFLKNVYNYV